MNGRNGQTTPVLVFPTHTYPVTELNSRGGWARLPHTRTAAVGWCSIRRMNHTPFAAPPAAYYNRANLLPFDPAAGRWIRLLHLLSTYHYAWDLFRTGCGIATPHGRDKRIPLRPPPPA